MTDQQQPTAAEQITNLQTQLTNARAEAYEARASLESAEERIKAIKNALQGAVIGQQFEQARAAEVQATQVDEPYPTDEAV